jgi:hypothetical protein
VIVWQCRPLDLADRFASIWLITSATFRIYNSIYKFRVLGYHVRTANGVVDNLCCKSKSDLWLSQHSVVCKTFLGCWSETLPPHQGTNTDLSCHGLSNHWVHTRCHVASARVVVGVWEHSAEKIATLKGESNRGIWRKLHNEELNNFLSSSKW